MTGANKSFTEGVQYAWDSTSLKYAESCLQLYKYKMIDQWEPLQRSPHLLFGGWYATALEHYHKHRANGMSHDDAELEVVSEALYNTWEYGEDGTGGGPWVSTDSLKTRENLIRTIVWYLEQFLDDPCETIILSDGSPMVEHSFKLPVDNDVIFCGHLDRGVLFAGKPYLQDQKTSKSTITSRYFLNYNPDTQISGMYPFAGRTIFNIPFRGMILDAAQIAVGFSRFERGFITVDEHSLNEWYDDTMHLISQVQTATRENYFPRNRSSCSKYAGCEFREICSKSPHVRPNFLKANFVQRERPWDPLENR